MYITLTIITRCAPYPHYNRFCSQNGASNHHHPSRSGPSDSYLDSKSTQDSLAQLDSRPVCAIADYSYTSPVFARPDPRAR